jgi:hypothetical protein
MRCEVNLAGLMDKGLNGTFVGVGESDCSFKFCSRGGSGMALVRSGFG